MEALSYEDPPCEAEVKRILHQHARKTYNADVIDDVRLTQVVDKVFERFGGVRNLGSMSGWLMCSRAMLEKNVICCIESMRENVYEPPKPKQYKNGEQKNPFYAYTVHHGHP